MANNIFKINGEGLRVPVVSSDPSSLENGLIWYNSTSHMFKQRVNGATETLGGGTTVFLDTAFRIQDDGDTSKQLAFQISGLTTSTTRTITMPDANVNLADVNNAVLVGGSRAFTANQSVGGFKFTSLAAGTSAGDSVRYEQVILINGTNAFTANQSLGGFKLTNVADPTTAQDAATKAYVDNALDGRAWKQSARAATTAALANSPTYNNGTAGVGATLTAGSNGALPAQDGVTLALNDILLVKNQASALQNGLYKVTTVGDGSNPYVLTRSTDNDSAAEMRAASVFIEEGTTQADYQYTQTADTVTMGTTALNWVLTSANSFSGHDMISLTGGQISVDLASTSGLESTNSGNAAGQLRIKLEASNPTIQIDGSNQLGVKFSTTTGGLRSYVDGLGVKVESSNPTIQINGSGEVGVKRDTTATGNLVTGANGLTAATDGTTLETSSNALRIKDLGVSNAKIATGVDAAKIADGSVSNTEFQYLDGVTSSIQTQFSNRVTGPASSTDNTLPRFDGTGGKLIQSSGITVDDSNNISGFEAFVHGSDGLKIGASTTDFYEHEYINAITLTASQTSAVAAAFTFAHASYEGVIIEYKIKEATTNNTRTGTLYITTNGSDTSLTDTFTEIGAGVGTTWDLNINGSNIEVRYTTTANTKTMRAIMKRIKA
jgi:hypothetical protein